MYTSFMYTLVNCKVIATLVEAAITDKASNMATSRKAGQSGRFKGFPKKANMAIARKVFDQFSFYQRGALASLQYEYF